MLHRKGIPFDLPAEELMHVALEEARLGDWRVKPNPKVGAALLTTRGELVADHHKQVGQNHAEREVLAECRRLGLDARGARIAVTLEPCAHQGRTPPCTDALIEAGVAEVIVAVTDPATWVDGRGLRALTQAGIKLTTDVLTAEAEVLNRGWLGAQRLQRPFVRAKMATSLDGGWASASGDSRWITRPAARHIGHELRSRADLIITGRGTVETDDPRFTVRNERGETVEYQPPVVVLSRKAGFELKQRKLALHPRGASVVTTPDLGAYLKTLFSQQIFEVHLEAGPALTQAFLTEGLVDELHLFMAPKLFGAGARGFAQPFLQGFLPGLELEFSQIETTYDGDLHLVMVPA